MYELIVLSILMDRAAHGYLIAKIVNNIVGPFARVNSGRLYPLLGKMQEAGLIVAVAQPEAEPEGGRTVNCYQITPAGREYFHQLLMDTSSNPGDYQKIFWLKTGMFYHLLPEERTYLLEHYRNYCQSHVIYLRTKLAELKKSDNSPDGPHHRGNVAGAVEHRIEHWQHELDWTEKLKVDLVKQAENERTLQPASA